MITQIILFFILILLIIIKIKIFIAQIILFFIVILLIILKIKIFKIFHQDPIKLGHGRPIELGLWRRTQDNRVRLGPNAIESCLRPKIIRPFAMTQMCWLTPTHPHLNASTPTSKLGLDASTSNPKLGLDASASNSKLGIFSQNTVDC